MSMQRYKKVESRTKDFNLFYAETGYLRQSFMTKVRIERQNG